MQLTLPGMYTNQALLNAFLRPYQLRGQPATAEQEIDRIRTAIRQRRPEPEIDGFLEKDFVLPVSGGALLLQAGDPRDGSFEFTFSVSQGKGGQAEVRLSAMKIFEDGPAGSTRWGFVFLSGGKAIFSLPEQRWSDNRRPTECWWESSESLTGRATVSRSGIPLTIVGIKPKVK